MKSIIVDNRISSEIEHSLEKLGFLVMKAPAHESLPVANSSHPDTLFFRLFDRLFCFSDYVESMLPILSDIREYHRNVSFTFVSESPSPTYPDDCALNALFIGGRVYAREKSLSGAIKEALKKESITLVSVKQGYPACSVMKLNEKSAITSDKGMAEALTKDGIDVLLINQGHISLPPHEYGFIGGASFVYRSTAYFFGSLNQHPDEVKILDFLEKQGLKAVFLSDAPLVDLGGASVFE